MCQKKLCYELAQYFIFHKKISEPFCFLKLNDLRGSLDRKDEILGGKGTEHGLDELELENF